MINRTRNIIGEFPVGYVFTPRDFPDDVGKQASINRILNNMVAAKELKKISKGRFYKAQQTEFGELPPDTFQIVKDLIEKNGIPIGYITGYTVFNDLGLTTQVSSVLQIGVANEKKAIQRDIYRIHFIKQQNLITKENIPLLRLLDCLRFFKTIPDTTPDKVCSQLLRLFLQLNEKQIQILKELALQYTPQVIALLGAILEVLNTNINTQMLMQALNPQTYYKLGISPSVLPNQQKWNIL